MKSTIYENKKDIRKVLNKRLFSLLFLAVLSVSCSGDNFNNHNPYIPGYNFSIQIDMTLPSYSQLQYASNGIYFNNGINSGVRGLIIFNTGSGFNAFDAACPNTALGACSTMSLAGIYAHCNCDESDYSLFTGQATTPGHDYPMKQYRISRNGNLLTVYN